GVVRAELRVVVLAGGGSGRKARVLRHVVGSAHADEASALQDRGTRAVFAERLDQRGDVVGVAGDDLKKAVLPGDERFVVDAHGIRLSEPELAALGEEALGPRQTLVELPVLVARRSAVDDDG